MEIGIDSFAAATVSSDANSAINNMNALGELLEAKRAHAIYTEIVRRTMDPGLLEYLGNDLMRLRVFPYYLHHPDAASGNASFRVPFERGLALYAELTKRVSGLALPAYVLDPPDGSGKIPVSSIR